MTPDSLSYVARIKRFHETWIMDDRIRESLAKDGNDSLTRELNINAKDVIGLLNPDQARPTLIQDLINFSHFWGEFRSASRSVLSEKGMPEQAADHAVFQYWRQGKMNLFADESGFHQSQMYPHAPYAIELSSGCFVGCWFCGLKETLNKQPFAGHARLILVDETLANRVLS